MPKSTQVWISDIANELIERELAVLNKGLSARRGDKFTTKPEFVANLIDDYFLNKS